MPVSWLLMFANIGTDRSILYDAGLQDLGILKIMIRSVI